MINSEDDYEKKLAILYEKIDKINENRKIDVLDDWETQSEIHKLTEEFRKEATPYLLAKKERENQENK